MSSIDQALISTLFNRKERFTQTFTLGEDSEAEEDACQRMLVDDLN
jgi:hypothetical protein